MPLPGWVEERRPVIESLPVLYWAVFWARGTSWAFDVLSTYGSDVTPNTLPSLRQRMVTRNGPVDRMKVCGPYWDSDTAYRVLTLAQNDPAFWQDVKDSAAYI